MRETDRTGWLIAGVILALAFVLRAPTFGDPALHTDEEFYFYVGQQMLDGRLPYVDIWDRKPFGFFLEMVSSRIGNDEGIKLIVRREV